MPGSIVSLPTGYNERRSIECLGKRMPKLSRRNHYVPQWYQKGFIRGTGSTLHYLDLDPPKRQLPNGRTITAKNLQLLSPK